MTDLTSSYLRLFDEPSGVAQAVETRGPREWADLCRTFERATGWPLTFLPGALPSGDREPMWSAPVDPGVGIPPGHVAIDLTSSAAPEVGGDVARIDLAGASELAGSIAHLVERVLRTEQILWQREAELAAGVPLVSRPQEQEHLAARLQSVLQGGALAIGCEAAALYLVDENTTHLNLRSMWNLPSERCTAPARELREANADLEALCGHAVVLENEVAFDDWRVPEICGAAVCVPVSSPTVVLGTLWLFARSPRPFSDAEVNVVEIVAGRLAADLEREMLLVANAEKSKTSRQLEAAERLQQNQLPSVAPLVDGWDIAGWTRQAGPVGGDFHDWSLRSSGELLLAVGDAMDGGLDAALCASALQASLRAHGPANVSAERLLDQLNLALWTGSAGDQYAGLFCSLLDPATGQLLFSSAGDPGAVLLSSHGWQAIANPTLALGVNPDTRYALYERWISPGDVLIVVSNGVHDATDREGRPWGLAGVAQTLTDHLDWSARKLADLVRTRLETHARSSSPDDRTVLVVKRLANNTRWS